MAFEGPAEPSDIDHVLRYKIARDVGTESGVSGLTDTQLRATPVPVTATVTSESTAEATASNPAYVEGQDAPLSQDLSGHLRTTTSIANGADAAKGTTTDAPVADNTTVASATAATGIALWKRLVNLGIAILAKLPTSYSSKQSVTRPSNTTPYTAGDVVGATAAAITFSAIGPAAGFIKLNDADLRIDVSSVPAGMTSFRLHLYSVTPPSALADNDPWDLPSGDRASYLGYIDLGTPVDVGSTLFMQTTGIGSKQIAMGATTSLFAYLVTNGAYTPSSAAVKSVRLSAQGI